MSECQAKNRSTCRVHGVRGVLQQVQSITEKASQRQELNEYIILREAAENLDEKNFSNPIPDLDHYRVEDWVDKNSQLLPNTPTNIVVAELNTGGEYQEEAASLLQQRGYSEGEILAAEHFGFDGYSNRNMDRYDFKEVSGFNATTCYLDVQKKYDVKFDAKFVREAGKQLKLDPAEPFQDVARGNVKNYVEALLGEAQKLKRRHGLHAVN